MMNDNLRETLIRKLEKLPDETARQLLDYVEFLGSKYHRSVRERSTFERLADNIEDTLSATRISRAAAKGTAQVLDAAGSMMRGVVAAGQAVVDELQGAAGTDESDHTKKDALTPTENASAEGEEPADEERLTKE